MGHPAGPVLRSWNPVPLELDEVQKVFGSQESRYQVIVCDLLGGYQMPDSTVSRLAVTFFRFLSAFFFFFPQVNTGNH